MYGANFSRSYVTTKYNGVETRHKLNKIKHKVAYPTIIWQFNNFQKLSIYNDNYIEITIHNVYVKGKYKNITYTAILFNPKIEQETNCNLDIDGNGKIDGLSDGLMIIRKMFGLDINAVTKGTVSRDCFACGKTEISHRLKKCMIDITKDGKVDALTDGFLMIRYMLGIRGKALTSGLGSNISSDKVEATLKDLMNN